MDMDMNVGTWYMSMKANAIAIAIRNCWRVVATGGWVIVVVAVAVVVYRCKCGCILYSDCAKSIYKSVKSIYMLFLLFM